MRMTQWIGLNHEADAFLSDNALKIGCRECPHCGKYTEEKYDLIEDNRSTIGMYDDEIKLKTYKLKDGRIAREVEQCSPWSSGPVIFTCLEIDGKRTFKWSGEEIENYL